MFNILICDDNIEFANSLVNKINKIFYKLNMDFNIDTRYNNFKNINYSQYDLFLLDVEIGSTNGIDLGNEIRKINQDAIIIYISSYLHYALYGYRVKASAYLLKEDQNFDETIEATIKEILGEISKYNERILIKEESEITRIKLKDILYIESYGRKVILNTSNGGKRETYSKISEMEKQLVEKGFLRIQKGYLANMSHIIKISGYKAYIDNGEIIKVTDKGYSEIVQKFILWKGKF